MNLSQILTSNIIAIFLLLVICNNYIRKHITKTFYKRFMLMLTVNIAQSLIDIIWLVIGGKKYWGSIAVGYIINSFSYINTILFAKLWLDFCYIRSFGRVNFKCNKIFRLLTLLPVMLVVTSAIVNIFFPILFTIDSNNQYVRGNIGFYVIFGVTYLFMLLGFLIAYTQRKTARSQLLGSTIWFIIPVIVASITQAILKGTSLLWIGTAIGIVLLYLSLQDEQAMMDELSGLFTRQYMNKYVRDKIQVSNSKNWLVGIMIDVDKFKKINDTFGHCVGDNVITRIGQILTVSIDSSKGMSARYGGDEFVVLTMISKREEIQLILDKILKNLELLNRSNALPLNINISMGFTEYKDGDNIDKFINRMDKEMYKKKQSGNVTISE